MNRSGIKIFQKGLRIKYYAEYLETILLFVIRDLREGARTTTCSIQMNYAASATLILVECFQRKDEKSTESYLAVSVDCAETFS